ncbi:hypothetical protein [Pontibacter beigongshangensis]|uniref:hypothetical protein n=1 Tax=Pontibacter beigongshangensis TaxID=2574733 RepID=UPI00164FCD1A|nr:hypothetical protein [Pontibacter beigongshangensis]
MNTTSNQSDLTIIAALFMLLLIYCSVCLKPADADVGVGNTKSVAATENSLTTVPILK